MLITGSAFRRAVSVVVMACLVAGPFAGALAAHHIFDVDGALEELAGTSVALTGVDVSSIDLSPAEASIVDPSLAAADAKAFSAAHDPASPSHPPTMTAMAAPSWCCMPRPQAWPCACGPCRRRRRPRA